jgi:serine protease Do
LGVSLQPLDEELAGVLGAPGGKGALVASVEPDSPAARGGLKQGDIVIGVAGKAVQKQRDMAEAVADAKPGSTVAVAVLRNGRRMEHQVAVGEPPGPAGRSTADGGQQGAPPGPLGLSLAARQGNEAGRAGVLVTGVVPGSAAEGRGLRAGDVILSIDDRTVATPRDVAGAVEAARNAGCPSVAVQVERGEGRASVALLLEAG